MSWKNYLNNNNFGATQFSKLNPHILLGLLDETIQEARNNIKKIKDNSDRPEFVNVCEALERSDMGLKWVGGTFFNLHSAETNDDFDKVARDFSPRLTDFQSEIALDEKLFEKLKTVHEQKDKLSLNKEQLKLLEKQFKGFVRNGALLSNEEKEKIKELDRQLSLLTLKFSENVLKATNQFEMVISDKAELKGLPDSVIEAAAEEANKHNHAGKWLFTLQYPSYMPFMTYSENRSLREKMFLARGSISFGDKQYDNVETLKKIVELRHERAMLLGHPTHAEFVLEERMAKDSQTVKTFLADFLLKSLPAAKNELQLLQQFASKKGGPDQLQHWDMAYWQEQMKQELFQVDDEELRQYFKLDNVLKGVFEIAQRLYGISFRAINTVDKYHPEVETFEVLDKNNKHLALFYADFFPRPGKRSGAWMTSYREQFKVDEKEYRPHVSIVCNFSRATASRPSLLTIEEVLTLFHEFGHALHGIFAEGHYDSLNGTNVYWDFVELPSQIMENWVYEKEALHLFAHHYETNKLIPDELIDQVIKSKNFMEGMGTLRQIRLGMLDMAWHGNVPEHIVDVPSFESQAIAKTELLPKIAAINTSCAFSHIFAGGYSAGYYSYKWAEVLDADAFDLFKQKGIFNREVASAFRNNILSRGGQEHPMDLYCRFRGKAPTVDALLKRAGLL